MISTHPEGASAPTARPALNLDLIRKYSMAGPRYTSYPPATQFHTHLAQVDVLGALREDNSGAPKPLSLYFHLPFCETRCWYCGCNTVITRRRGAADEYLDDLQREMELLQPLLDSGRRVTQMHLGGGTPTFLTPVQLERLRTMIEARYTFDADAEVSVELDPRRLTREHVQALAALGAKRASLGIQDTNREVQLAIHRYQPHDLNRQAVQWLREAGFTSINVDLIYGLPLQTRTTFARTLTDVQELSPDRLSVFSYAHVPWIKPSQRIFEDRGQLPEADEKLAMFATAHEFLTQAGYVDVGLDHFARPEDELAQALSAGTLHRNFQGYSTRAGASLYGFGVSSISQTETIYRQAPKDLVAYRAALQAGQLPVERGLRLSAEDQRRRALVMGIMCHRGLDYARASQETGVPVAEYYAEEIASLRDLADDGIVTMDTKGFRVTAEGVPLLRVVAMRFDATLSQAAGRHAKVI